MDDRESGLNPEWGHLIAAVSATDLAVLLLEPPGDTIVAASPAAVRLVCAGSEQPAGRRLVEVFGGADSGGLELIAQGKVSAYETSRWLRTTGEPVHVRVRSLPEGSPRCAVVLLSRPPGPTMRPTRQMVGRVVAIGSVRADLMICSLTSDIAGVVGFDAEKLIGTSILRLIEPADAGKLLELIASASAHGTRSAQIMPVRMREGRHVRCEMLLVPHTHDGGYAFTIMDVRDTPNSGDQALRTSLQMLTREATSTTVTGDADSQRTEKLLGKLGSRELEIVTELLEGNRVPAIATKLYLSPGTVRNHLSTAFRKLGVHNQQELIDLLRSSGALRV